MRNPLWVMRNDVEDRLTELGKQLGLTSTARIRAGVAHDQADPADDEADELVAIAEYRRRLRALE